MGRHHQKLQDFMLPPDFFLFVGMVMNVDQGRVSYKYKYIDLSLDTKGYCAFMWWWKICCFSDLYVCSQLQLHMNAAFL